MGYAEIPTGYSDKDGQPKDMDMDVPIRGSRVRPMDLLDGVAVGGGDAATAGEIAGSTLDTLPLSVRNALAEEAFRQAEEQYSQLPGEERDKTTPGAFAGRIHAALVRDYCQARESTGPALSSSPVISPEIPAAVHTATPAAEPLSGGFITTTAASGGGGAIGGQLQVDAAAVQAGVRAALQQLGLPGLRDTPFAPSIQVELEYAAESGYRRHDLRLHWLTMYRGDDNQITQISVVFDTRYGSSPLRDLDITFSATDTMRLLARDGGSGEIEIEALRGMLHAQLGVFDIAIFTAAK